MFFENVLLYEWLLTRHTGLKITEKTKNVNDYAGVSKHGSR